MLNRYRIQLYVILSSLFLLVTGNTAPLFCYQCNKTDNAPCPEEALLPCPITKDRCVTHITKDAVSGYKIRRECGLAPCNFKDEMMNKGLGLNHCDTTKEDFFCVFCCKENGCNRDAASSASASVLALASVLLMHLWALVLAQNQ